MATLRREYSRWKAGPQKTEYTNCIKLHQIAESQEKNHLNSCTMIQNDESRGLVGDGLGFVAISLSCPGSLDRNALLVAAKEASLGRALHVPGFELDPALLEPLRLGWWISAPTQKNHPRDEVEKFPCEKMGELQLHE